MSKKIEIELSQKSIKEAINQIQQIQNKTKENIKAATIDLMEATKAELIRIFEDNSLSNHINSIESEVIDDGTGFRIWSSDWIVIFNEYGTGVKGEGTHPNPKGYSYNIQSEFKDEFGRWVYYNDETKSFVTTSGMPAKLMFYTVERMLNESANEFYSTAINLAINNEQYQSFRNSLRG